MERREEVSEERGGLYRFRERVNTYPTYLEMTVAAYAKPFLGHNPTFLSHKSLGGGRTAWITRVIFPGVIFHIRQRVQSLANPASPRLQADALSYLIGKVVS
jgi:hypothetical protein